MTSTPIKNTEDELEEKLNELYTEIENKLPPQTLNKSEQTWNDGFYKGQLKALELVSVKLFNKSGDKLTGANAISAQIKL